MLNLTLKVLTSSSQAFKWLQWSTWSIRSPVATRVAARHLPAPPPPLHQSQPPLKPLHLLRALRVRLLTGSALGLAGQGRPAVRRESVRLTVPNMASVSCP